MTDTKVTLLTWTQLPLETVYSVWNASKTEGRLMTPAEVAEAVPPDEVEKLFRAVIAQRIPIGEHIQFVFMIEGVSISWREQAVRHRIGVKPSPERVGADIVHLDSIPDLANSSWWSQSMRLMDMGRFADNGAYRVPPSVLESGLEPAYSEAMQIIQTLYNQLVEAGVPREDARDLIPLGAQHRISWSLNMSALQHIIGERGCWILQLGIWGPVIMGMVQELAKKVHPIFQEVVTPPCLRPGDDDFHGCVYHEECRRRLTGDDQLPPCPLHLAQHQVQDPDRVRLKVHREDFVITHPETGDPAPLPMRRQMLARIEDYTKFWGRDCYTGERLNAT
jgi:hypothetical protein